MINTLPEYLHPWRMAERGTEFSGQLLLTDCLRLHDFLSKTSGDIAVTLKLAKDLENICYLQGTLQTILSLTCQRCLQPLSLPLQLRFSLSPVANEAAAKKLPSQYEPLLLSQDQVSLVEIIEEEILLALPFAPKHKEEECSF